MDSRMRQDLDNYITGHYGEDQFREDDMDKQDVKIIIDASTTREDAETLIEFLSKLLNETMSIEAIVSLTLEDNENDATYRVIIHEPENS